MCTIGKQYSPTPLESCTGAWEEHTPQAVGDASAVAYFFARELYEVLDIPVGLLITDWGGTPIEAWMDEPTLREGFGSEFVFAHLEGGTSPEKYPNCSPCMLWNGQVAPLGEELEGFELAGADRVFKPATARVRGGTVVVRSPQVPEPVAVRYCFRNWCRGTLFNSYGIPALPFRSDDWPLN